MANMLMVPTGEFCNPVAHFILAKTDDGAVDDALYGVDRTQGPSPWTSHRSPLYNNPSIVPLPLV